MNEHSLLAKFQNVDKKCNELMQPYPSHDPYKLNYNMVPVLPSLVFPFNLLPSPMHPTGFFSMYS